MMKKILIAIFFTLLLNACDYKPIYSLDDKNNFTIMNVSYQGDQEINGLINQKILRFRNTTSEKKYNLNIKSNYIKRPESKDTEGITTRYKLIASVNFEITNKDLSKEIKITKDFSMKNMSNEFDEKLYENNIKDNLSEMIVNELVIYLNRLK